jgi:tRNA (adenine57-N1/adenine58-N1)-methyltransferase
VWNLHGTHAQDGDLAELVGLRHKYYIVRLETDKDFQSHRGVLKHNDLIGKPWGSLVYSHLGSPFYLLQPSLGEILRELPRNTQILYPKDIGYILVNMGIGPGQTILEAGTGSGSLTSAFAYAIGQSGKIYSYDVKPEAQKLAIKNLTRLGLVDRVDFKIRNIAEGFDETCVDALFLDVPTPHEFIAQVKAALKPGGFFGCILPTTNQVSKLLHALRIYNFGFVDVVETMLRFYKPEPERLRPTDRMVAHTGFLIFGRPIITPVTEGFDFENDNSGNQNLSPDE